MPALFPRWTNFVARGSLLAIVLVTGGVPLGLMLWVRSSYATGEGAHVVQPIAFDHRVHAAALRIDCRYCHATADRTAAAGMPPTIACVGCHNDVWRESAQFAPVRASLISDRPIEWQRVNRLPDFVFFNHSIHVAKGVGCETCHGRVDRMAEVAQATPLSMRWCLDCHRSPTGSLRPRDATATMGWIPEKQVGAAVSVARVRRLTNCSTCHR